MPEIEIGTETEGANQWRYAVRVFEGGRRFDYSVTLSWADYDLWSHGRVAPERVVRALFAYLLRNEPAANIKSQFDCSVVRRFFPDIDAELPKMI